MSNREASRSGQFDGELTRTDKPAIGVITSADCADETARIVLRARRNGHPVLVTYREEEEEGKAVSFASDLGAQIVTPGAERDDESLVRSLTNASRQLDFPGLIVHTDLEEYIDYDRSVLEYTREDTRSEEHTSELQSPA